VRHLMGTLRFPLSIAGIAAPYVVGTVRDLIPRRRFSAGDDRHGQGAYETMKEIPFPPDDPAIYGVMGHTHAPDVQQLRHHGTRSLYYINCGSWAPSWREERPDLTGKTIYSFVLFDLIDGHYKHKCLEWRDDRGCPTEAVILNEHAG
jgi:hypothetical protein